MLKLIIKFLKSAISVLLEIGKRVNRFKYLDKFNRMRNFFNIIKKIFKFGLLLINVLIVFSMGILMPGSSGLLDEGFEHLINFIKKIIRIIRNWLSKLIEEEKIPEPMDWYIQASNEKVERAK